MMKGCNFHHHHHHHHHEKIGVRQYKKSELPRLRWTSQLHELFVEAVESLGGKYKATPKRIMQTMSVKGLKISQVKSHLQMYRSLKDNSINVFLPMNRRHEKGGHSKDDSSRAVFSSFSTHSQSRPLGNYLRHEVKDLEHVMYSESDDNEINGNSLLIKDHEAAGKQQPIHQDTHASVLGGRFSMEEETCQCELSLSFTPSMMMTEYQKEGELWPSSDEHNISQSSSSGHFSNSPDFQEVGSNHINLDLTI